VTGKQLPSAANATEWTGLLSAAASWLVGKRAAKVQWLAAGQML